MKTRSGVIPEGTLPVGLGLLVNGLGSYLFLMVCSRSLSSEGYGAIGVLWASVFLAGPGLFFPLEQELGRAIAQRRTQGNGIGPVVAKAATLGSAICVAVAVIGLTIARPLLDSLFDSDVRMISAAVLSLFGYLALHLVRGISSGLGRFAPYGVAMAADASLRLLVAVGLAVGGVDDASLYGLSLGAAPLVASAIVIPRLAGSLRGGPDAPWGELSRAVVWLFMGSLFAQFLVNAGPLTLKLVSTQGSDPKIGPFLSGLVIARIPLFLFMALQAALLPKLSALASAGRRKELVSAVVRSSAAVALLGLMAAAGAYLVGPQVVAALFGPEQRLPAADLSGLAIGTAAYMLAMTISQALIAMSAHARSAVGWGCGAVVFILVVLFTEGTVARVEWSYIAGSAAAGLAMASLVASSRSSRAVTDPEPVTIALEP